MKAEIFLLLPSGRGRPRRLPFPSITLPLSLFVLCSIYISFTCLMHRQPPSCWRFKQPPETVHLSFIPFPSITSNNINIISAPTSYPTPLNTERQISYLARDRFRSIRGRNDIKRAALTSGTMQYETRLTAADSSCNVEGKGRLREANPDALLSSTVLPVIRTL